MLEKRIIILKDYSASKPKGTLILTFSNGGLKADIKMSDTNNFGNVLILQGETVSLYVSELKNIKDVMFSTLGSDLTCIIADKNKASGLIPKYFGTHGKGSVNKESMLKRAQERVVGNLILPEPKEDSISGDKKKLEIEDSINEDKKKLEIHDTVEKKDEKSDFSEMKTNKDDGINSSETVEDSGLNNKGEEIYIESQPYDEKTEYKLTPKDPQEQEKIFKEEDLESFYAEKFDFIIDDPFMNEDTTLSDIDIISDNNYFLNDSGGSILEGNWKNYDNEADSNSLKNRLKTDNIKLEIKPEQDTRKPADGFWENYDKKAANGGAYMEYYNSIKEKLLPLLKNNEQDEALTAMIPESEFVKVYYAKDKYYCVGIVRENGQPLYICYAVQSKYSETAPPQFEGRSRFVPLNPAEPRGDGYFMLFQSADNGKCIN